LALRDWAQRETPTDADWNFVEKWLRLLDGKSWAWPSVPDEDLRHLTDLPNYEARRADLTTDSGTVRVTYRVTYNSPDEGAPDIVDLLKIVTVAQTE
jgi:hypothetical protein